jgi:hypothetical protein
MYITNYIECYAFQGIQNAIVLRRHGTRVLKGRDVGRKHGKHIEAKPLTQFGGYVERSIRLISQTLFIAN